MLQNVVEEMAIASGVPVPQIYVMDDETGINAFAAGFTPATRSIARHARLPRRSSTRDELQGVIAHEFSHILNGDMRLNLRLIGILNGILRDRADRLHVLPATRAIGADSRAAATTRTTAARSCSDAAGRRWR